MQRVKPAAIWGSSGMFATATAGVSYGYFLQPAAWPGWLKLAAACLIAVGVAAAAAWTWRRTIPPCLAALRPPSAVLCVLLGLVCGFGLVVVTPIPPAHGLLASTPALSAASQQTVLSLLAGLCMAGPIAVLALWLASREASVARGFRGTGLQTSGEDAGQTPTPLPQGVLARWAWLGYALPPIAAGIAYLIIFWPALMSNDSLGQWSEMLSGQYSDMAPAFHGMTNWLITRIWLCPAAVALTQVLLLGLVVAWSLKRLRQWGMPRGLAWTTCAGMSLLPATGILAITLWKDIPYSICVLLLTLWIMEMIHSGGAWLSRRFSWILLGTVLALVALYRHNGLPLAVGTPILLAVPYHRYWRRLALALAAASLLIWGVRGPLYHCVAKPIPLAANQRQAGIGGVYDYFWAALCIQQIAAHTAAHTPLRPEEQALLESLYPLQDGRWPYNPYCFDGGLNIDLLYSWQKWEAKKEDLTALAMRLFRRRPTVYLRHVLTSSSYLWGISGPKDRGYYIVAFVEGPPVRYQVLREVKGNGAAVVEWLEPRVPLPRIVAKTFRQKWLFWRPAIYLYLVVLAAVIAMLRSRSPRYGLILLPLLLHTGFLAAVTMSQEFRFQFPVYLVSVLYSGFLLFCTPRAVAPGVRDGVYRFAVRAGLPRNPAAPDAAVALTPPDSGCIIAGLGR
ncbi:MAG: hypothetical protein ABSG86_03755 [Thermoguttaceae bacterium]|jgi:hypothetical protein